MAAATRAPLLLVFATATLLGLARSAGAECPWSPEDANDNAKIQAHQACKEDELIVAYQRMSKARMAMSDRMKALVDLLPRTDQQKVVFGQRHWEQASERCPPLNNGLEETPEHLLCQEQDYLERAKFLDARVTECLAGPCDLSAF